MVMLTSPSATSSPSPPAVGTFIDNGAFQLVEILGYGGYGIVYRAIPTMHPGPDPPSFAVKCLPAKRQSSTLSRHRTRDPHLHETQLHSLASTPPHPNIITLHKSIVDPISQHTYIIMDFAPGGDLFTQILHKRAFLGHGERIRNVFIQLIDAVERCHERGVYHRDLKPENILCWDTDEEIKARRRNSQEMRVALTDFGLATREIWSKEFRTGSVYHMSPECHGPSSASTTSSGLAGYSPPQSDLFSLGIILLNLITGRNPWKSAAPNDPTFQAYCREPQTFLMSVLPISREVNDALVGSSSPFGSAGGLLSLNPNHRLPGGFAALKQRIRSIREFYSSDVVFEGGMARCGWEVESGPVPDEDSDDEDAHGDFVRGPSEVAQKEANVQVEEMDPSKLEAWQTEDQSETTWQTSNPTSHWSASTDGDSDMVFTHHRRPSLSWTPTPVTPRSHTPTSVHFTISRSRSRPSPSIVFSRPSPSSSGSEYSSGTPEPPLTPPATSVTGRMRLRLNTNLGPNAGTGSGYVQHVSPASRTTLISQSPYTLRSGVSPMATHIVTRSPYARIQPNSPYDSTTILMEANGDEIEEEMRTAIEMDDMGYWHGGDNELIPIPMSAKSPLDEQPLPIPRRDIGYGDSFYDSSTDSESESEDDVRMSMARSYGPEDPLPQVTIQDVGMEFTYTDFTYEYSYSTATNALQDDANNRMSVISASTTIASNGAVDDHNRMSIIETHNRMSIVAMTPTSAISNENRMSIIPTMPMPSTSGAAPPARPESPILGLSFMPLPSTSTQPMTMPEPTPPIPIPAPTYRDGSHRYHEAEARQEAATYSFLTTDPTATNGDDTSSYAVPSFTLSAYPSSSFAPTTQTLGRNSGFTGPDDSWSFFTSTDLDLDLKLVTPISPAPLPIRPPPTPPTHYPSFSRSSRSRSRRPSRRARERTIERKSRAMAAATGTPAPVTQEEKGPRPRRSASSFLALSLSSMGLGGFKRSREESPAPPPTTTTGNGTKPPPPTPASSNPSSQTQPLQVQGQFSTHWTLSTSVSVCAAREQARSREAGEIRRRRKLRGWFSPGKLFAAVLPSSSS